MKESKQLAISPTKIFHPEVRKEELERSLKRLHVLLLLEVFGSLGAVFLITTQVQQEVVFTFENPEVVILVLSVLSLAITAPIHHARSMELERVREHLSDQ